jgi:mannitol-1-phosphate/altronate dehydrogenase
LGRYLKDLITYDLTATQTGENDEQRSLGTAAIEAIDNNGAKQKWEDLAQAPTTQWRDCLLTALLDSKQIKGKFSPRLVLSFAALIAHSRGKFGKLKFKCKDSPQINKLYTEAWHEYDESPSSVRELVSIVFEEESVWKQDLNAISGLHRSVSTALIDILDTGIPETLRRAQRG